MGLFSRWRARRTARKAPTYKISVDPTPAGYTRTTAGTMVKTPGTPAQPGITVSGGTAPTPKVSRGVSVAPTPIKVDAKPAPSLTVIEKPSVPSRVEPKRPELMVSPYEGKPIVSEPTPFWTREVPSMVKEKTLLVSEQFETAFALGGKFAYRPDYSLTGFETVTEPSVTGERATMITRPITTEEMQPIQKFKKVAVEEQVEASFALTGMAKELRGKYQEKIDIGEMPLEKAQKQMEVEFGAREEPIKRKYEARVKEAETTLGKEVRMRALPYTFGKGVAFGAIAAVAPPLAWTAVGIGVTGMAFKFPEVITEFKTYPKEAALGVGVGLTGAVVGGVAVTTVTPRVTGYFRTVKLKDLPAVKVIEPGVLTGKQAFPTAPAHLRYTTFVKSPYKLPGEVRLGVWHAAPQKFAKEFVVKPGKYRPGEPTGLYVAPSLSAYFLRVSGMKYKLFGIKTESILGGRPTALRIYPTGIGRGIRGRLGFAEIAGGKPEVQAVFPLGTPLEKIGATYFVKWKGFRIPIHEYQVVGVGVKGITPLKPLKTFGQISKEYGYYGKPTPIVTPSILGYSLTMPKESLILPPKFDISPRYVPSYKLAPVGLRRAYGISLAPLKPYKAPRYPMREGLGLVSPAYPAYYPEPYFLQEPYFLPPRKIKAGRKIKRKKETVARPFYRYPSVAVLGLKETKFELPKVKMPGEFEVTGIQTRFDIPGAIKLKKSKKKKKKRR